MYLQIFLDIKDFDSLSLRTCTCVKPVKNEPMAPLSLIFSWLRACGIRKKSALRSALSTIAAEPRIPERPSACETSPAGDLSHERESSEQFVWLNRRYDETETQLSRSAMMPSIRADSSQSEGI